MYYIHPDHLGSPHFITNASGNNVQEVSFDACLSTGALAKVEGRQRNPADWSYNATIAPKFDRGYTFHEHLSDFDLINMNGRVYDPVIARFLSPDPMLQSPGNLQNYNRYSYVFNNPLKYTDPSGYISRQHLSAGDAALINELDDLFPPGSSGSYAAACESFWDEFSTMLNFMGTDGNSNSPYQYNFQTGQYINSSGQSVHFSSVFNNFIKPNAAKPSPEQMAKIGWHEIGTDALGSKAYIIDGEIGAYVVLPFWAITGSYYNTAYYWGGIAA
ncbi:MAG: RHS repeat domain-containing protein, partial [Mariniphaga sp.]